MNQLCKAVDDRIVSMDHKHFFRLFLKSAQPFQKAFPVRMAADAVQFTDLRSHLDLLTKKLHLIRAFNDGPSQRSHCLITHEENRTFRPPEVVFQMVLDSACLAHAAGGKNHFRIRIKVDIFGIIAGDRGPKAVKTNGVDAFFHQLHGLFIVIVPHMLLEDRRRLQRQRTVHKDLEAVMIFHQMVLLDLSDEIQHLLGPAHGKGRNHQIAAPVKGPLHDGCQLFHIIRLRAMAPVAIGRFHHHIVRFFQIFRIPD